MPFLELNHVEKQYIVQGNSMYTLWINTVEFWHILHYISVQNLPNFPVPLFTQCRTMYMEFQYTVHGIVYVKYMEFTCARFP